jgi:hypothetical protein
MAVPAEKGTVVALNNRVRWRTDLKETTMRKSNETKSLRARKARNNALALAMTFSLAAFGCTTNRTPGNGQPVSPTPGLGDAPSTTPGSSSGSPMPQSMISSADEALEIMAALELRNGKILGVVNPGPTVQRQQTLQIVTGQNQLAAYGQNTVNRTISSDGVPAVISGDDGGVIVDSGVFIAPATGTTSSGVTLATNGGAIGGGSSTLISAPATTPVLTNVGMTNSAINASSTSSSLTPGALSVTTPGSALNSTTVLGNVPTTGVALALPGTGVTATTTGSTTSGSTGTTASAVDPTTASAVAATTTNGTAASVGLGGGGALNIPIPLATTDTTTSGDTNAVTTGRAAGSRTTAATTASSTSSTPRVRSAAVPATPTTASSTAGTTSTGRASGVRVVTNPDGTITVTNDPKQRSSVKP